MNIELSLQGKFALVTAGADGIGLAIAQTLSAAGAQVAVCDISAPALEALELNSPRIHAFKADVSKEDEVQALFESLDTRFGRLDILVNNAGISGPTGRTDTLSLAEWNRTLGVNLTGQFLCARAAIPRLLRGAQPSIVNLSSIAGHMGVAGRTPYVASKWAVIGFSKALALELGPEGVRVNTVLPGIVEGPRIDKVIAARAQSYDMSFDDMKNQYTQHVSLGKMTRAKDIAQMVLFLCSDLASNVHGQELTVDGYTQMLN